MTSKREWRDRLEGTTDAEIVEILDRNSGLPGPRGNLELADAFAESARRDLILRLSDDPDEYRRFCGTQGIGRLLVDDPRSTGLLDILRGRAGEERWRVREAAARALQLLGNHDRGRLREVVAAWVADADPLVRRAAIAAICEPRLLSDDATRTAALEACRSATDAVAAAPADRRRDPSLRVLRQALGYCWSVAIAAAPGAGLSAFAGLEASADPDVRWIVAENRKKARLRKLLG